MFNLSLYLIPFKLEAEHPFPRDVRYRGSVLKPS